ncbi:hypothetical protein ACFLQ4_00800 [Bacteroidota bacterium]
MKKKRKVILIVISSIILLLTSLFFISPYSNALLKSKSHFIKHPGNDIVLFEPGAEEYAGKIAAFLPAAIERVELVHGLPFKEPFKVYVCNTQKSFNEYTAITSPSPYPIRGTALLGDVLIAPSAFNFIGMDTHRETLMHELSHLHFRQSLGFFKGRKHPAWFSEGFADYVAGSGGEGIEENEAINFILNGKHFIPEEEGEIFGSFDNALNGLSGPMFHKQAKMFVTYIINSDSLKFKSFLIKIQEGESFSETFNNVMGLKIQNVWAQFLLHLEEPSR